MNGPWKVILIYAIAIPAAVYLVVANTLNLGADGKEMLATVVGLGGVGLAVWRYWNG
jgi:hypothetical protein